jgi:GNAT superfamily N-acetyltransferase
MLHGACTRKHALAAVGGHRLKCAIRAGALVPLWPRVLVRASSQLDPWTKAAAATLSVGTGAVLWGPTAAKLHGCTAVRATAVHVAVPYNRWSRPQRGLTIRHGRISADDVCELDGLPAMTIEAAVCELLCTARPRLALACADQAMAAQPAEQRAGFAAAVADHLARRADRRGVRQATGLLELISADAESPRESWLRLLAVTAGFPPPVVQHPICDLDGRTVWRLDLAWPQLLIALEYDGYEAHLGRARQDQVRDEDLRRRGWLVVHARTRDLRNPGRVIDELTAAFRQRGGTIGSWRATAV